MRVPALSPKGAIPALEELAQCLNIDAVALLGLFLIRLPAAPDASTCPLGLFFGTEDGAPRVAMCLGHGPAAPD
eukprot:CAMPEP_0117590378 /NCGR_PEP_ID=MMETSP0784-20121206/70944_1 /TAXON_ID=39447 /ORGANISM="" /LENGTH=73 /DNA_ID=CAMNT_0005391983 /DNA_START=155 /DNA_END=374 /DNA_ORIENTATION=+